MRLFLTIVALCVLSASSYAQSVNTSPLTYGNVQMGLKKDITTQTEVLERFGAPNITTLDAEGNDVWTYQANATSGNTKKKSGFATLFIVGGSAETVGFNQSTKTMTLIIKFNTDKTVKDFKSMSSSF